MSDSDKDKSATGANDGASDRIRETTKWIIASFAAVGAALVAGTQVSGIGELHPWGPRMWLAALGGALALLGIAVAIWKGSTVLVAGAVALNELEHRTAPQSVATLLRDNPVLYGGYENVAALHRAFEVATREMKVAFSRLYAEKRPTDELKDAAARADLQADLVSQVVSRLLDAASTTIVRASFTASRPWLFAGALATASGVGIFTWAVNPPKPTNDTPLTVRVTPMRTAEIVLSAEGVRILGPQLGANCDTRRLLTVTPKAGTSGPLWVVAVPTENCEPVQFALTQAMGAILASP
jgi:hypothetical protein